MKFLSNCALRVIKLWVRFPAKRRFCVGLRNIVHLHVLSFFTTTFNLIAKYDRSVLFATIKVHEG